MRIFVSYGRRDRSRADSLAQRLRQLHHEPWLDTGLTGGQAWWDEILQRIRESDALLLVVSSGYLSSQACESERKYALELKKPLLPVAVEPIRPELLPAEVARVQVVDYSTPGEDSAINLAVALSGLRPMDSLPDPLPAPPPVPISYLSNLSHQIAVATLGLDDQLALVSKLESAYERTDDPEDQAAVIDLLHRLSQRPDLYAESERRVQRILGAGPTEPLYDSSTQLPRRSRTPSDSRDTSSPQVKAESWTGEVQWQSALGASWRARLQLSHEDHLVEFAYTFFGFDRLLIDNREVWKGYGIPKRGIEVEIRDGDVMRTLRIRVRKGSDDDSDFDSIVSVDDVVLF
jgi:hypothetical protein